MILLSSISAATTAVAIVFSLIDAAIIAFVIVMVYLILKDKKTNKLEERAAEKPADVKSEVPVKEAASTVVILKEVKAEPQKETPVKETLKTDTKPLTFDEAYAALSKEQKSFLDGILEYAKRKPNTKEAKTKSNISVKIKNNLLVKLTISRETAVASFSIEDTTLRTYRRDAARTSGAKIKVRATDVPLVDLAAFEAAKGLVDVALEQIVEEYL